MTQNTEIKHDFEMPDSDEAIEMDQELKPLRCRLETDHYGIAFQTRDVEDYHSCDVLVENHGGVLVAHLATATNSGQHKYRIVLGRVVDGLLVPYEPTAEEPAELEIDHNA